MRCNLPPEALTSQPLPNSITVLRNVGVVIYFEWNTRACTAMEDNLLEELLGIANSDAPVQSEVATNTSFPIHSLTGSGGRDNHSLRYLWNASELWIFQARRTICCCRLPSCLQGKWRRMVTHCCWLLLSSSRKDVAQ